MLRAVASGVAASSSERRGGFGPAKIAVLSCLRFIVVVAGLAGRSSDESCEVRWTWPRPRTVLNLLAGFETVLGMDSRLRCMSRERVPRACLNQTVSSDCTRRSSRSNPNVGARSAAHDDADACLQAESMRARTGAAERGLRAGVKRSACPGLVAVVNRERRERSLQLPAVVASVPASK